MELRIDNQLDEQTEMLIKNIIGALDQFQGEAGQKRYQTICLEQTLVHCALNPYK